MEFAWNILPCLTHWNIHLHNGLFRRYRFVQPQYFLHQRIRWGNEAHTWHGFPELIWIKSPKWWRPSRADDSKKEWPTSRRSLLIWSATAWEFTAINLSRRSKSLSATTTRVVGVSLSSQRRRTFADAVLFSRKNAKPTNLLKRPRQKTTFEFEITKLSAPNIMVHGDALWRRAGSFAKYSFITAVTVQFGEEMVANLQPIVKSVSSFAGSRFVGNGTSLDPSLGEGRFVDTAVWTLSEVLVFCL